jgi:membrane-associated phospholipid phosphatase
MHWQDVVLGYLSYLAVASWTRCDFAGARRPLLLAAAVAWGAFAVFGRARLSPALAVLLPSLVLLAGYRLSGLLFVRPDVRLERWLRSVDDRVLTQSGVLPWFQRSPRVVQEYFELSYLLVYLAVPAGATTLVGSGHADSVNRFWVVVLLAEFACYAMLPWLQTRPPRAIEAETPSRVLARRLNLRIVGRASVQANTIPSGHAAGALATALAVASIMPVAGTVFLLLAASIAAATVLGRYHYVVDTVLGVLVAAVVSTVIQP